MANVNEITRESWILSTFPEWGTWLNEEIEEEVVLEGNFAMWWLGCVGVWIKTPAGANICMDLWCSRGKSTKKVKDMVRGHQMANMAGVRKLQPNLRAPVGIADKMTSIDLLRMAECLRAKVIIPVHHDIWTNFMASTQEIIDLWRMRKDRLQYKFHPFIWEVGGKYVYPRDKDLIEYHHPRGFDDCFEQEPNIQFKSML